MPKTEQAKLIHNVYWSLENVKISFPAKNEKMKKCQIYKADKSRI